MDVKKFYECIQAFEELKTFLSSPPLLSRPIKDEPLYLYISAGHETIAAVLVIEEGTEQQPVYYVSRSLKGQSIHRTLNHVGSLHS